MPRLRSSRVEPYVVDSTPPPPPPSPGFLERLMRRPKNSRIAPAPPPAFVDPILTFTPKLSTPKRSLRSLRSIFGIGSSTVDTRHAGIRRSRKMSKSRRRRKTRRRH